MNDIRSIFKEKNNINSPTQAELIGVLNGVPFIIGCRYLTEVQNYTVEDVYICQDN